MQYAHPPTRGTGQAVLMSLKCVSTPIFIGAGATTTDSSNAAGITKNTYYFFLIRLSTGYLAFIVSIIELAQPMSLAFSPAVRIASLCIQV